ncbi:MAG TPA: RNA methyltransferase [Anaerolineales bacterium]|nr:RNA methyltransferase [Anaerolineales bacterium]
MITSTANPKVKWVRALQLKRKAREEERLFVVEGIRLAREAVAAGVPARLVMHTETLDARGRGLANSLARLGAEVELVSESVMAACSDTDTPPGLLAVVERPDLPFPQALTLALVADGLADPGNLGTTLRTALAAGAQAFFLAGDTVDPFNPKVVRGAMGAHFHIPIRKLAAGEAAAALAGLHVWLAEAAEGGIPYYAVDWRAPSAVIIGSEAGGPGALTRELAADRTHIPISPASESLNAAVAAAVILFEIARQRGSP